ncbi:MAG: hypothetical protein RR646_06050 [Erysipelotrichaceae bacterium]
MREAAFRDDMKPVVERLSIITLDGNKIKNTDRTITESGPQWTSSHSGTSMDQHTSAVQLEYSTAMKEEVCFSELEKDVKFEDLELAFKQMKEEREIALGRSVTIQEEFNLRDKYYKQRSITNFEHSMDSDLEGISQFLDYCPIIGGVKQTLEGIIGTTLSGELINDLEAENMVVMGIFSTGIDLIPLGSILKSCNTVKSLAVSATKDIVTSEAIGYTNSFMASCGAPPSSLIIMNLLATSVFTHYNTVSPIKDLDVTPTKANSTNLDYIEDAFSGKTKSMFGDNNDVVTIEKVVSNEIDIKVYYEKQNADIKDSFLSTKGASGANIDDFLRGMNAEDSKRYLEWNFLVMKDFTAKERYNLSKFDSIKTQLDYTTSTGIKLQGTQGKTTTIVGNYQDDMKDIVNELGDIDSFNFGAKNGGFNVLNVPDEIADSMSKQQFWEEYNSKWLQEAISREDIIKVATPPLPKYKYFLDKKGVQCLKGFGREIDMLEKAGYAYDDVAKAFVK